MWVLRRNCCLDEDGKFLSIRLYTISSNHYIMFDTRKGLNESLMPVLVALFDVIYVRLAISKMGCWLLLLLR